MRTWSIVTVLVIGIIALVYSFYSGIAGVFNAEKDLLARLNALSQSYASMNADYVAPLLSSHVLPDGDKESLEQISTQMKDLGATKNPNQQFEKLLALQRSIIVFFNLPGLPEEFTQDTRYVNWNTNASNVGHVSRLVYDYNVALSLYNARLLTPSGKIASYWHTLDHRSYIGIDGTLQDQTHVSF